DLTLDRPPTHPQGVTEAVHREEAQHAAPIRLVSRLLRHRPGGFVVYGPILHCGGLVVESASSRLLTLDRALASALPNSRQRLSIRFRSPFAHMSPTTFNRCWDPTSYNSLVTAAGIDSPVQYRFPFPGSRILNRTP